MINLLINVLKQLSIYDKGTRFLEILVSKN